MAGKYFGSYFTLTVACLCFIESDHASIREQYKQGHINLYTVVYNIHSQDSWYETDLPYVNSGHSII